MYTIVHKIAFFMLKKKIIKEDNLVWFEYLLERWIFQISLLVCLGCVGSIQVGFIETLIFLFNFYFIRRRAGGYHADTRRKCFVISLLLQTISLGYTNYALMKKRQYLLVLDILTVVSFLVLWLIYPHKYEAYGIDENGWRENKERTRKIVKLEIAVFILGNIIGHDESEMVFEYSKYYSIAICLTAFSIFLSKIIQEDKKKAE